MCEEKTIRKHKRLAKQEKQKRTKRTATLSQQQALMHINKRYKKGTRIKVTVNL